MSAITDLSPNQLTSPVWHPFTQMQTAEPPLKVKRGQGAFLELEDGNRLIDCISSWWVTIHGHAHPRIAHAIAEQAKHLEQVIFAGFTHEPAETLARLLIEHLPENLSHVFYSDNGSTAVEVALKMAIQYWRNLGLSKQCKFIGFEGGYHGDTVGAMSIGGSSPFWDAFKSLMFEIDVAPFPYTFDYDKNVEEKEENAIAKVKEMLAKGIYAGIVIEPLIQGAAGMRMCRPKFLQSLRQLADQYKTLLIFDEVMTGFGRTGQLFASLRANTTPDIITLSKGITGGFLPLSVTCCKPHIYNAFLSEDPRKALFHSHSYTANPIACAAAIESLAMLKENPDAFERMEHIHRRLAEKYLYSINSLKRFRFTGTIAAFDIETGQNAGYFDPIAKDLKKQFLDANLLLRTLGNTIYFMPPYCVDEELLSLIYERTAAVLKCALSPAMA